MNLKFGKTLQVSEYYTLTYPAVLIRFITKSVTNMYIFKTITHVPKKSIKNFVF